MNRGYCLCWQILFHLDSLLLWSLWDQVSWGLGLSLFQFYFFFVLGPPCLPLVLVFCFTPMVGLGWPLFPTCGLFQHFSPILTCSLLVMGSHVWCRIFSPGLLMFLLPGRGFSLTKCQLWVVILQVVLELQACPSSCFMLGHLAFVCCCPPLGWTSFEHTYGEGFLCPSMNKTENCIFLYSL